jgi:hypothetical protein
VGRKDSDIHISTALKRPCSAGVQPCTPCSAHQTICRFSYKIVSERQSRTQVRNQTSLGQLFCRRDIFLLANRNYSTKQVMVGGGTKDGHTIRHRTGCGGEASEPISQIILNIWWDVVIRISPSRLTSLA